MADENLGDYFGSGHSYNGGALSDPSGLFGWTNGQAILYALIAIFIFAYATNYNDFGDSVNDLVMPSKGRSSGRSGRT
jgi:hypothetical protein